ncbi:MAG: hypothetical protein GDYSWBUE_001028 [Candidatus Fervidibacterota bacterium]
MCEALAQMRLMGESQATSDLDDGMSSKCLTPSRGGI